MKKHLNTLFVTTKGAYLGKDGETVAVKIENQVRLRIPIHTLEGIVCFGPVSASPYLMGFCAKKGVGISFLSEYGRFLARVQGPVSGNVLLRREQYRQADDPENTLAIARSCMIGKFANSRTVLQRGIRDHGEKIDAGKVKSASDYLKHHMKKIPGVQSLNTLRGYEGDGAKTYFSVLDQLILSSEKEFRFESRSRRPPMDRINCLLSFMYTMLMHDIRSALEVAGLDPDVGFLHRDRPGRSGLALDLMEEMRPVIADRLVLSLINLRKIKAKDFDIAETGEVKMKEDTLKKLLTSYQEKKQATIFHPFVEKQVTIGLLFHIQALLLARYFRGDLDGYPPFIWK